jgi:hypothetical protein
MVLKLLEMRIYWYLLSLHHPLTKKIGLLFKAPMHYLLVFWC